MDNNFYDNVMGQLEQIKKIVSDYDEFCKIAETLQWLTIDEAHYNWCTDYVESVYIHYFKFPKDYLKNNLNDAYVRTIISDMCFYEGWDKNTWNTDILKRLEYLTHGKKLYNSYSSVLCPRFKEITYSHLKDEIDIFRKKDIDPDEYDKCIRYFKDAFIMEIGGYYAEDHTCLAVKEDILVLVDYGAWD